MTTERKRSSRGIGGPSISRRLPIIVLLVVVAAIVVTASVGGVFTSAGLTDVQQDSLETLASIQGRLIEQQLNQHAARLESLANNSRIQQQLDFSNRRFETSSDTEEVQSRPQVWREAVSGETVDENNDLVRRITNDSSSRILQEESDNIAFGLGIETTFLLVDSQGDLVGASHLPSKFNHVDALWWQQVQVHQSLYVNGPRTLIGAAQAIGSEIISALEFAQPVFDPESGEMIGAIYSAYDYGVVREQIRETQTGGTGRTALLDEKGEILFVAASLNVLNLTSLPIEEASGQLYTFLGPEDNDGNQTEFSATIVDLASNIDAIEELAWHVAAIQPRSDIEAPINQAIFQSAAIAMALGIVLIGALILFYIRPLTQDLNRLREGAQALEEGNLDTQVAMRRQDELGVLAGTFNTMAQRLRRQIEEQEAVIAQRTAALRRRAAQLETASRVGRVATASLDLDQLMADTVNLIRDQFGYYHASLFLLDDDRQYAVVRESTGEVGQIMKSKPHKLAVGSNSIVGWTTANKSPRIALNVGQDAVHFNNPLLPDTQSEVALPLIAQQDLLGALDVQSTEVNAFDEEDLAVLQLMADQVATAIANARLFREVQAQAQQRRRVIEIWQQLNTLRSPNQIIQQAVSQIQEIFHYDGVYIVSADEQEWSIQSAAAEDESLLAPVGLNRPIGAGVPGKTIAQGSSVLAADRRKSDEASLYDTDLPQAAGEAAAPIYSGEQIYGAIGLYSVHSNRLNQNDVALLELMATAVGSAVANANLLGQTEENLDELNRLYRQVAESRADIQSITEIVYTPENADATAETNELMRIPLVSRGQQIGELTVEDGSDPLSEEDTVLAKAIADQVALALESSQLFEQTAIRLQESDALFNLTSLLTTTLDPNEIYRRAARAMTELLNVSRCAVSSWDKKADLVRDEAEFIRDTADQTINEYETEHSIYPLAKHKGTAHVLETFEPLVRHIDDPDLEQSEKKILESLQHHTVLEVALITGNEAIGVVELFRSQNQPDFSDYEIRLAQSMANQTATAIRNATLAADTQNRVAELRTLYRISETLALAPDLKSVLDSARREILSLTNATGVAVSLLDESRRELSWVYVYEYGMELDVSEIPAKPADEGFSGHVIRTGEPLLENEITEERMKLYASEVLAGAFPAAYMGLPLKVANEIIGVLSVENHDDIQAFSENDLQLLTTIASSLGIAVQNQRLLEQTQAALVIQSQQSLQLQAAAEISAAASSILNQAELISSAVQLIQERFALYYVGLFLVDEESNMAVLRAGTGEAGRIQLANKHQLEVGGRSLIGRACADGEARIVQDVTSNEEWRPNPILPDTRAELALPLRVRGRNIGALTVQSTEPDEFVDALVSVLQTMTDQLATAIDNVQLLAETEERARRQRVLNEISTRLHKSADIEQIINIGLQALSEELDGAAVELILSQAQNGGNGHS